MSDLILFINQFFSVLVYLNVYDFYEYFINTFEQVVYPDTSLIIMYNSVGLQIIHNNEFTFGQLQIKVLKCIVSGDPCNAFFNHVYIILYRYYVIYIQVFVGKGINSSCCIFYQVSITVESFVQIMLDFI